MKKEKIPVPMKKEEHVGYVVLHPGN